MRRILLTACLLAGLALAACGGDDDDEERADRPCLPAGAAFEQAALKHVDRIVVGTETVDGDAERIEVDPCRMSDEDGTAVVTVFGVRDDSIEDQRHEVTLERRDGAWTIVRDLDTHRCREGRGHRDFSTLPCS